MLLGNVRFGLVCIMGFDDSLGRLYPINDCSFICSLIAPFTCSSSEPMRYRMHETTSLSHANSTFISPLPPSFQGRYSLSTAAFRWWHPFCLMIHLVFLYTPFSSVLLHFITPVWSAFLCTTCIYRVEAGDGSVSCGILIFGD